MALILLLVGLRAPVAQQAPAIQLLEPPLFQAGVLHAGYAAQGPQGRRNFLHRLVVFYLVAVTPNGEIGVDVKQGPVTLFAALIAVDFRSGDEAFRVGELDPSIAVGAAALELEGDANGRVGSLYYLASGDLLDGLEGQPFGQIEG